MDHIAVELPNGKVLHFPVGKGYCRRYYTLLDRLGTAKLRTDLPADKLREAIADARENVTIHMQVCDECQSYWKELKTYVEQNGNRDLQDPTESE